MTSLRVSFKKELVAQIRNQPAVAELRKDGTPVTVTNGGPTFAEYGDETIWTSAPDGPLEVNTLGAGNLRVDDMLTMTVSIGISHAGRDADDQEDRAGLLADAVLAAIADHDAWTPWRATRAPGVSLSDLRPTSMRGPVTAHTDRGALTLAEIDVTAHLRHTC